MTQLSVWPTDAAAGQVTGEAKWRKMARLWAPTKVVKGVAGELVPSLAGTTVTVAPGAIWIDGHYAELVGAATVETAGNGYVVARVNPASSAAELVFTTSFSPGSPTGTANAAIAQITGGTLVDLRQIHDPLSPIKAAVHEIELTIPPGTTISSGGGNPVWSIAVPKAPWARDLEITATICPFNDDNTGTVPMAFNISAAGFNEVRFAHTIDKGVSVTVQTSRRLAANTAMDISAQLKALSGSRTVTFTGGITMNALTVLEMPAD